MSNASQTFGGGAYCLAAPDGTQVHGRALTMRDIADLESLALHAYRKQLINGFKQTYAAIYDDPQVAQQKLEEKAEQLARLSPDKIPDFEGVPPVDPRLGETTNEPIRIPWPAYWMTFTFDGVIHSTWLSVRNADQSISLKAWEESLGRWGFTFVKQLSDAVGEATRPKLEGNPEAL